MKFGKPVALVKEWANMGSLCESRMAWKCLLTYSFYYCYNNYRDYLVKQQPDDPGGYQPHHYSPRKNHFRFFPFQYYFFLQSQLGL